MGRPQYDNGALKIQPVYSPQNLIGNCTEFIQVMRVKVAIRCENLRSKRGEGLSEQLDDYQLLNKGRSMAKTGTTGKFYNVIFLKPLIP
jgi:hypothetical protein